MKKNNLSDSSYLRRKAEEMLKTRSDVACTDVACNVSTCNVSTCNVSTVADTQKLIHELEVHQIELEMQNDELMLAKEQAAFASEKYIELYDFAPTGYFTLSKKGEIIQLNLCAAAMLGKERSRLIKSLFLFFVSPDSKPIFIQFLDKLFTSQTKETCEVALNTPDNIPIYVYLTGIATTENDQCFITAVDISERKKFEEIHTFLLTCGYPGSTENFFESMARYLSQILDMEYVCIDKLLGDGLTAQTVAIFNEGKFDSNISYTLNQTPCGDVVGKTICCFPENVCNLFPHDAALHDLKAESYIGTTLWSFDGKPIGLIAIIGQKPLDNTAFAEDVLKLVSIRASGELERMQVEQDLIAAKEHGEERERNLKLANEKYLRSNQLLEESQTIAKVGGYEYNLLTGELYWTAEAYRVHDASPDEFKPTLESGMDYFLPESKRIIQEAFELTMSEGKGYDLDLETYTTKGRKINVRTTCQVSSVDGNGKPVKFTGIFQDISEQKKTEQDLIAAKEHAEESEAMLKAAMENSQAGIAIAEFPSGKLKYVNKTALLIRDKGYDEIVKDSDLDTYVSSWQILHHDGTPYKTDEVPLARAILYAETNSSEFIVRRDNNEDRYVWANAAPIFNSKGIQTSAIVVFLDITERKEAEAALLKSESEFRLLAESMPQIVWITRPDGWNIYFNQQWVEYTGLSLEESYGSGWNKPFHPDDQQRAWDAWQYATSNFATYSIECRLRRFDGVYKWWLIRGVPVLDEQGAVVKWFGTCTDIDEMKKSEVDLIAAKEHAEESDRLKTSFLANMSHEIRTPMNSIMGFASLLPEEESKELIANYANIIVQNSEQLVHIIDDIVLYSRLQTKLLSFMPYPFDVQQLLFEVKQSFNLPEFSKDVELKIETDTESAVMINSDIDKLRQIFTNLVSNAFKYTTKGSITIGFTIQKNEMVFYVKDTGIGIPPNELERVFERFYRGSNVSKGLIGGTGLGLSIVKELVDLLGGKIWVENNEGEGSVFYFAIPYLKETKQNG